MNIEDIDDFFNSKTDEELNSITTPYLDTYNYDPPKGWVDIETFLPRMFASDIFQGFTKIKVRYSDGDEGESGVSDHNTWYYLAKEEGITHWYNDV